MADDVPKSFLGRLLMIVTDPERAKREAKAYHERTAPEREARRAKLDQEQKAEIARQEQSKADAKAYRIRDELDGENSIARALAQSEGTSRQLDALRASGQISLSTRAYNALGGGSAIDGELILPGGVSSLANPYVPPGRAYLNDAAQSKAQTAPAVAKPAAAPRPQSAAPSSSDGQTAGYSRVSKTGKAVTVRGYSTPKR